MAWLPASGNGGNICVWICRSRHTEPDGRSDDYARTYGNAGFYASSHTDAHFNIYAFTGADAHPCFSVSHA